MGVSIMNIVAITVKLGQECKLPVKQHICYGRRKDYPEKDSSNDGTLTAPWFWHFVY